MAALARAVARTATSTHARHHVRSCSLLPRLSPLPSFLPSHFSPLWCRSLTSRSATAAATSTADGTERPPKLTTYIVGLDVVPNGREVFIGLQREILASITEYNKQLGFEPPCNEYSRRFAEHRLRIAEEEDDVVTIEHRIWSGQIEELIVQAENELDTVVLLNEEVRPWEAPSAAELAEYQELASPNMGQDPEQFKTGRPPVITPEEQRQIDEFWAPIDEEIRADQAREAEERRVRKENKARR